MIETTVVSGPREGQSPEPSAGVRRTRIKVCGITRPADALAAAALGVDAIGLVFYPPSPRYVTPEQAAEIIAALPPFVTAVGLFVNAAPDEVRAVRARLSLPLVQFHGNETPEYCRSLGAPFVKAVHVGADTDVATELRRYRRARAVLLDTKVSDLYGGSGESFAWDQVKARFDVPIVVAGGLTAANVGEAIHSLSPFAVDVSTGVESDKGEKDAALMEAFVTAVRNADAQAGGGQSDGTTSAAEAESLEPVQ